MGSQQNLKFDALVLGGGIAGLEAALNLAEQDFSVAVVEKDASIGGKMIRLSKVFPTLDCSSCITTPKMAAAAHHPKDHPPHLLRAAIAGAPGRRPGGADYPKARAMWTWRSASAAASANISARCWSPMASRVALRPGRPFISPSPTPFPRRP